MSFERGIRTKLCEAALAIYQADAQALDYWQARMYVGPWVGDDASIVTPQINIATVPQGITVGIGGFSRNSAAIVVGMFEPLTAGRTELGAVSPHDRLEHLARLLLKGSPDPVTGEFLTPGKLIDPDNATSIDTTRRFLNTSVPDIQEYPTQRMSRNGQDVCLTYGFVATFQTQIDSFTGLRA